MDVLTPLLWFLAFHSCVQIFRLVVFDYSAGFKFAQKIHLASKNFSFMYRSMNFEFLASRGQVLNLRHLALHLRQEFFFTRRFTLPFNRTSFTWSTFEETRLREHVWSLLLNILILHEEVLFFLTGFLCFQSGSF